ncbi:MAG TPA: flagellar hook-length control protein FliK, partial [Oxalicibacterium sp.]|nr:flagellar hook-length control protein FliK [Oxalicibacterium sp.]
MLQRADITGARPVLLIEATTPPAPVGDGRQDAFDRLSQLALGKEFQAQVLSRLVDGSYLVKIDDAVAGMKLPAGTKAGDVIDLTLLATEPRPTFLLGKADSGAVASFSQAGRLIANLLQLAQQDGAPPAAIAGKVPLLAAPGAPGAHIASALQHAFSFSGLFYESHVAQWANGTRSLAELLKEPPAKLLLPLPAEQSPTQAGSAKPEQPATLGAPPQVLPLPADLLRKLAVAAKEAANGERAPSDILHELKGKLLIAQDGSDAPLRPDTTLNAEGAKLVSLQLDALEQRRVLWQGELFAGQPFEWEVADDTPRGRQGQDASAQSWQSSVRFSLPTLGAVQATVRLTGDHVRVDVRAADAHTA